MIIGWLSTPTTDDRSQVTRRILPDSMDMSRRLQVRQCDRSSCGCGVPMLWQLCNIATGFER